MCNTFVVCLDKIDILCIYLPHCTSVWTNEGFVVCLFVCLFVCVCEGRREGVKLGYYTTLTIGIHDNNISHAWFKSNSLNHTNTSV